MPARCTLSDRRPLLPLRPDGQISRMVPWYLLECATPAYSERKQYLPLHLKPSRHALEALKRLAVGAALCRLKASRQVYERMFVSFRWFRRDTHAADCADIQQKN